MVSFLTRIQLKRQHSAEPVNSPSPNNRNSPASNSPSTGTPAPSTSVAGASATGSASNATVSALASDNTVESIVGSPFKKQRASLPGFDEGIRKTLGGDLIGASSALANAIGMSAEHSKSSDGVKKETMDEDEEL